MVALSKLISAFTDVRANLHSLAGGSRFTLPLPSGHLPPRYPTISPHGMEDHSIIFPDRVSDVIQNSTKSSTRRSYASKFLFLLHFLRFLLHLLCFCSWLGLHQSPPATARLPLVFDFLLSLRDLGLSHWSVRVYLAAISAYHNHVDSFMFFPHNFSKRFLKGMLHVYPLLKHHVEPWDLPLVLRCLTKPPFEPVATCKLRLFSWKTLFLVVITSTWRVGELAALDIRPPFLTFLPHAVCLSTNMTFLSEVVSEFHINSVITLPDFYPDSKMLLESLYIL